mgnify:CR=1 FL=1
MATETTRPIHSFHCATVRASIWKKDGKYGAFHAVTLSRTFTDGEGNPKSSGSFGRHDLSAVATVVAQAEGWIREHAA